jgi:DNA topoisomerase VI subunit A
VHEETPCRVFSVHVFNDSKRFEVLKGALVTLARRHQPEWADLADDEALREMGLVANPGHLYLSGAWWLVDEAGQVLTLGEFYPSAGLPASQAARVRQVRVDATRVVCVENQTTFYELIHHQGQGLAAICLWGNPSPACRNLLHSLAQTLPEHVPLLVWADLDYGGLNILAQLRRLCPRFAPYHMDIATLDGHAQWGKPLTRTDEKNLARLAYHPLLPDMRPLIAHMLARGIKLEQEAIAFTSA